MSSSDDHRRSFIYQIVSFFMIGLALYGLAHLYTLMSSDPIIKYTKKCKYCKQRINEKVCLFSPRFWLFCYFILTTHPSVDTLCQLHQLAGWARGAGSLLIQYVGRNRSHSVHEVVILQRGWQQALICGVISALSPLVQRLFVHMVSAQSCKFYISIYTTKLLYVSYCAPRVSEQGLSCEQRLFCRRESSKFSLETKQYRRFACGCSRAA
jgi:hypothetical protein